jgi:hypothetical protein
MTFRKNVLLHSSGLPNVVQVAEEMFRMTRPVD